MEFTNNDKTFRITNTSTDIDPYIKYRNDFENEVIVSEPILSDESERFTVYPINHWTIWAIYKNMLACNWGVEEVDLSKDINQWENILEESDKRFIMNVLAFFAAFDGIVNCNIKQNLIDVVKIKEAECAYGKQFEMENVHGEMYSLMLDTFVKDDVLKENLINSIETMPTIKAKAQWCKKWIESDKSYAHKLVAFAIVEGVFFSGAFASIFWLKSRPGNLMPGLIKSNRFIARDEALHVDLACAMYALLKNRLKQEIVFEIMEEAVEIEIAFIIESLPERLLAINSDLMTQHIKMCADRLLVQLGYEKLYRAEKCLDFMDKIDVYCKVNFFESRNDEYADSKINNPRIFEIMEEGF